VTCAYVKKFPLRMCVFIFMRLGEKVQYCLMHFPVSFNRHKSSKVEEILKYLAGHACEETVFHTKFKVPHIMFSETSSETKTAANVINKPMCRSKTISLSLCLSLSRFLNDQSFNSSRFS